MTLKPFYSIAAMAALATGLSSASALASDEAQPVNAQINLRTAIVRAAEQASHDQPTATVPARGKTRVAKQSTSGSGSGGGGHTKMVVSLIGVAAGIGTTYYVVKETQKETATLTSQVH